MNCSVLFWEGQSSREPLGRPGSGLVWLYFWTSLGRRDAFVTVFHRSAQTKLDEEMELEETLNKSLLKFTAEFIVGNWASKAAH